MSMASPLPQPPTSGGVQCFASLKELHEETVVNYHPLCQQQLFIMWNLGSLDACRNPKSLCKVVTILSLMGCCIVIYTETIVNHPFSLHDNLRSIFLKNQSQATIQEEVPEDSSLLSIRGIGDSQLPFQNKFAAQINDPLEDIFTEKPKGVDPPNSGNLILKKILLWNDAYSKKHFGVGYGQQPFLLANCRVNTCTTTSDRERFRNEDLDAVVWHFRASDRSLPSGKSPHTHYVFWNMESASYLYGNISLYHNVFNWTFTYRLDSDFPNPYGNVYRRRVPLPMPDLRNVTAGKTKMAAWFVSNCQSASKREVFVDKLMQFMKVDIYGGCGELKCERSHQWDTCYKMVERDYKFYFSFENSFCQDYVTEKFFNLLRFSVVPVVYGFGNYSAVAPPHSYINALDFPTAEALAKYLLYLDRNDTAYNEYFLWKPYHHFPLHWDKTMKPWCDLCERLHTDQKEKTYDLKKWYVEDSHCKRSFRDARNFLNTQ